MTEFKQDAAAPRNFRVGRKPAVLVAGAAGVAVAALAAIPALATAGSGFTPTSLSSTLFGPLNEHANKPGIWGVQLNAHGQTLVAVDKVAIAPGGQSGWHTHAGPILISITSGSVLWTDGDTCVTTQYNAGQGLVEPANHLHLVRNASPSQPAEMVGTHLRPPGSPGRVDAAAPSNNCGL